MSLSVTSEVPVLDRGAEQVALHAHQLMALVPRFRDGDVWQSFYDTGKSYNVKAGILTQNSSAALGFRSAARPTREIVLIPVATTGEGRAPTTAPAPRSHTRRSGMISSRRRIAAPRPGKGRGGSAPGWSTPGSAR